MLCCKVRETATEKLSSTHCFQFHFSPPLWSMALCVCGQDGVIAPSLWGEPWNKASVKLKGKFVKNPGSFIWPMQ